MQIEWQPKTSLGVTAMTADTSAETPDTLPGGAGAEAHVKYSSRTNFGAVLMTLKPVTLHAYNDERLFLAWLEANRAALYYHHGPELKRYGLWLVSRTHSAKGASINTWVKDNRSALVSLKAKAAMLGDLGQGLDWADQMFDKDWCHYRANEGEGGLVLFLDGIEVKPRQWWLEGFKRTLLGAPTPPSQREQGVPNAHPAIPRPLTMKHDGALDAFKQDLGHGFDRAVKPKKTPPRDLSRRGRDPVQPPPRVASLQREERPTTLVADDDEDMSVLQDAGLLQFGRAASLRKSSYPGSLRSHSLRRESRSVADEKEKLG